MDVPERESLRNKESTEVEDGETLLRRLLDEINELKPHIIHHFQQKAQDSDDDFDFFSLGGTSSF